MKEQLIELFEITEEQAEQIIALYKEEENMTIKEVRKAMRALSSGETLLVPGWGQIQKLGHGYAIGPLPENDNSDAMHDYTDWSYGWREKWILDNIIASNIL